MKNPESAAPLHAPAAPRTVSPPTRRLRHSALTSSLAALIAAVVSLGATAEAQTTEVTVAQVDSAAEPASHERPRGAAHALRTSGRSSSWRQSWRTRVLAGVGTMVWAQMMLWAVPAAIVLTILGNILIAVASGGCASVAIVEPS